MAAQPQAGDNEFHQLQYAIKSLAQLGNGILTCTRCKPEDVETTRHTFNGLQRALEFHIKHFKNLLQLYLDAGSSVPGSRSGEIHEIGKECIEMAMKMSPFALIILNSISPGAPKIEAQRILPEFLQLANSFRDNVMNLNRTADEVEKIGVGIFAAKNSLKFPQVIGKLGGKSYIGNYWQWRSTEVQHGVLISHPVGEPAKRNSMNILGVAVTSITMHGDPKQWLKYTKYRADPIPAATQPITQAAFIKLEFPNGKSKVLLVPAQDSEKWVKALMNARNDKPLNVTNRGVQFNQSLSMPAPVVSLETYNSALDSPTSAYTTSSQAGFDGESQFERSNSGRPPSSGPSQYGGFAPGSRPLSTGPMNSSSMTPNSGSGPLPGGPPRRPVSSGPINPSSVMSGGFPNTSPAALPPGPPRTNSRPLSSGPINPTTIRSEGGSPSVPPRRPVSSGPINPSTVFSTGSSSAPGIPPGGPPRRPLSSGPINPALVHSAAPAAGAPPRRPVSSGPINPSLIQSAGVSPGGPPRRPVSSGPINPSLVQSTGAPTRNPPNQPIPVVPRPNPLQSSGPISQSQIQSNDNDDWDKPLGPIRSSFEPLSDDDPWGAPPATPPPAPGNVDEWGNPITSGPTDEWNNPRPSPIPTNVSSPPVRPMSGAFALPGMAGGLPPRLTRESRGTTEEAYNPRPSGGRGAHSHQGSSPFVPPPSTSPLPPSSSPLPPTSPSPSNAPPAAKVGGPSGRAGPPAQLGGPLPGRGGPPSATRGTPPVRGRGAPPTRGRGGPPGAPFPSGTPPIAGRGAPPSPSGRAGAPLPSSAPPPPRSQSAEDDLEELNSLALLDDLKFDDLNFGGQDFGSMTLASGLAELDDFMF